MSVDIASLGIFLAAGFAGAAVMSFSGFAFSPVAGAIMLLAVPATSFVPLLMICSTIVQVVTFLHLRQQLAFKRNSHMLLGGVFGVMLAVPLLRRIDIHTFHVGFGSFLAIYALVMLLRPRNCLRVAKTKPIRLGVGFLGGLVGGLTAMPGAIPVLFCDCTGAGKDEQRATVQPFILSMQLSALTLMALRGDLDRQVAWFTLLMLPGLAAGMILGLALFRRVPEGRFRQVVLVILLATGLGYIGRSGLDLGSAAARLREMPAASDVTSLLRLSRSDVTAPKTR